MTPEETKTKHWRGHFAAREALPDEFWEHRRAARREHLLAWRSLLDAAIERMEPGAAKADRHMMPPADFWEHRRAARREHMLALRSLLDATLAHTEEPPAATHIDVS
jgi:hypothetical protein